MKIDVLLVSEQIIANLIPSLMSRPDKVCLVCTPEMLKKGEQLKALFSDFGITTEEVREMPDTGMMAITRYAEALIALLQEVYPNCELRLNATGGTKLMSFGFMDAFRRHGLPAIYTDTAHARIEVLPDQQGNVAEPQAMSDVLDVKAYLQAQGFHYQSATSDEPAWQETFRARQSTARFLANNAMNLGAFFSVLNGMAASALEQLDKEGNLLHPVQTFKRQPMGAWAKALRMAEEDGLITWDGGLELRFSHAEAAKFLNGIWLEEYAYAAAKDVGLFDVASSVNVQPTANTKNEFDLLACDCNQLLFIECKTLRFKPNENDNELTYKIDALSTQARGLFGKTWLLSAQEPTQVLLERAEKSHIRLIGPKQLANLASMLTAWRPSSQKQS